MMKTKFQPKGVLLLTLVLALLLSACAAPANGGRTVKDGDTVGSGAAEFPLEITDKDGVPIHCTVKTDKQTVGAALIELGLIAGEQGEFGLYIKTVNGHTYDYDRDGCYWAFYINDAYALTGVDMTEIAAGESYALRVE